MPAWPDVCAESKLDAVWAWSSHQSLLTRPCDGLPDITAAVISGGKTALLYSAAVDHSEKALRVCVCE